MPFSTLFLFVPNFKLINLISVYSPVVKYCDNPGNVTNSNQTGGYHFNDTVSYTCVLGFEMTSGDPELTCQADATWSGTLPICSSMEK